MDIVDRLQTQSKVNLNRKHFSTCSANQEDQEQKQLVEKMKRMEQQYARMEIEYSRKVKELKTNLIEKNRKQISLIAQLNSLRDDFKVHQEQIIKVGDQLKSQENKEGQLKSSKKNSSPGLIKKSLDIDKYKNKQSPGTHKTHKVAQINLGQVKKNQYGQNASPKIKRLSPRGNPNGILNLLKQDPIQGFIKPKQKLVKQKQKQSSGQQQHHSGKKVLKTSGEPRKKAYSPKGIEQAKVLINSMKTINKADSAHSNGSPRRPIRRSPGSNAVLNKDYTKKQGKKLLGGLKQEIQEVF